MIFGQLTNQYVVVSNYPGTTVTVTRGWMNQSSGPVLLLDSPGVNNLLPNSEDELVTRNILLETPEANLVQVIDTKNLKRGLFLTIQLSELGRYGSVVLNMWDEAQLAGYTVDTARLQKSFGVSFLPAVAIHNSGLSDLRTKTEYQAFSYSIQYPELIEEALKELAPYLNVLGKSSRGLGLMALSGDPTYFQFLQEKLPPTVVEKIQEICKKTALAINTDLRQLIDSTRMMEAQKITNLVLRQTHPKKEKKVWSSLEKISLHPVGGFLVLAAVLYFLYLFVGVLGAGTMVNWMEEKIFEQYLNPFLIHTCDYLLPFPHQHEYSEGIIYKEYHRNEPLLWWQKIFRFLHDFLVGEYGVFTMALTYGLAIIFPVVLTFFLAFGILEDLGYLSRLSVLLNQTFRIMGLNGKAVLPMILGLGCDTMATVTTRILDTKKERIIATFLLALAVPCSAQLAVIMFLLEAGGLGLKGILIWSGIVLMIIFIAGALASLLIRGEENPLILEIPPLRLPLLRNIFLKTLARVEWYLKEVIPIFLIGTAILFLLKELKLLTKIETLLYPIVVQWLGLPQESAFAFLMGFFRRDYGAAGFIKMAQEGTITKEQILVGLTTITLFVPCVANLLVMIKERGWKIGIYIFCIVMFLAFLIGGLLYRGLQWFPGIL